MIAFMDTEKVWGWWLRANEVGSESRRRGVGGNSSVFLPYSFVFLTPCFVVCFYEKCINRYGGFCSRLGLLNSASFCTPHANVPII